MSLYYYYANPRIHFFPRGLKNLLREEKQTADDGVEKIEKKCELSDILDTYDEDKNYSLAGTCFKNIESRIYLDLWNNYQDSEYTVVKKFCIGFLSEKNGRQNFTSKEAYFYSLELKCEVSDNSQVTAYLETDGIDNSKDPKNPLSINMNHVENRIKEVSVAVKYKDSAAITENTQLKIYAKFANTNDWKTTFTLSLYRNAETSLDEFQQNRMQKDTDFFVLPRTTPTANQKKCIKQLQIINNQVFARNASLEGFTFVEENGEVSKTVDGTIKEIHKEMAKNACKSLDAFGYNSETDTGCKSGSKIGLFETKYLYSFTNYGHQKGFIDYLSYEYSLDADILKGLIYDRNFLFGNYKKGDPDSKVEGIVNLYEHVVIPFIENLSEQINLFHNFNHPWLSCPKYNKNYKRGPFSITNGISKNLYIGKTGNVCSLASLGYAGNQESNILPVGSVVNFKTGKDEYAFEKSGEHYYEVESVTIQGSKYSAGDNIFIKLSLQDKQTCNDSLSPCNRGNYNTTEFDYGNYGIPYYIHSYSDMPRWGNRADKMKKLELLNWNENQNNWYSYTAKPNTEEFGIDCSGFVVNAITGIDVSENHYLSTTTLDITAVMIGENYCRRIPITENYNSYSYLTKNDIVFSRYHIAFCSDGSISRDFNNEYVAKAHFADRKFSICHNYGSEYIWTDSVQQFNLFVVKNIQGQFEHWNAKIKDDIVSSSVAHIGRIYLWS